MREKKIPQPTIERLPIYYRSLLEMQREGLDRVSSEELGRRSHVSSVQIRKDLTYFGEFGKRGFGYKIKDLLQHIASILGLTATKKIAVFGAGNLGRALIRYSGFANENFKIVAAFDRDVQKVGDKINDVMVYDCKMLDKLVAEEEIEIGIIAVPAEAAQDAADRLSEAGVTGILNFAPTKIIVSDKVKLRDVDLGIEMLRLSYHLAQH